MQPAQPRSHPLRRRLLRLTAGFALAATAVAVWHGVYVPFAWLSPWTEPLLESRAVHLAARHAVISLLPSPRIRLIDAELRNSLSDTPMARAGLLALTLAVEPGAGQRWLQLDGLQIRDAEVWIDETAGEGSNWAAWRRVPPRSDRTFRLPRTLSLQNTLIYYRNAAIGSLSARIDQLKLTKDGSSDSHLAVRLQHPKLTGNLQINALIQAEDDRWQAQNLSGDFNGRYGQHPWSLTVALTGAQRLETDAEAPLSLNHLRVYARRDDDPDEHQAVFSAAAVRIHPNDGRSFFRFAEWTYTHEKAEAWTFHAAVDAALGTLNIEPASIEGSEGLPAKPMRLSIRCRPATPSHSVDTKPHSQWPKPIWIWQDGWFGWANEFRSAANRPDDYAVLSCPGPGN